MNKLFLLLILFTNLAIKTSAIHEYVYPVGHLKHDGTKLLLLYQKSIHHIELWYWDPNTQEINKALLSRYTPAGLQILPSGNAFSFIDNDTIAIKYLYKRSPKSIPLYEPLYDFTTLQWIDERNCILSAKEYDTFGIYIIDVDGQCCQLLHDTHHDFRYPQLINNTLFYIQKDAHEHHHIMQSTIDVYDILTKKNITANELLEGAQERQYASVSQPNKILNCPSGAMAFLHMINEHEGFYLEHATCVERHDALIHFSYHNIFHENDCDSWLDGVLFEFSIPFAYLLSKDDRLYESILPFVPRVVDNYIYYCTCQEGSVATQLMRYDMKTRKNTILTEGNHSVMAPYMLENTLWYGGTVLHDIKTTEAPIAWINKEGAFCVQLPFCQ